MSARKFVKTIKVNCEDASCRNEFFLDYYVLEKEVSVDGFSLNTYGIEICKRCQGADNTSRVEYRKIFDVFCTEREAVAALEKMARNAVTPVSMLDVLEQMIGVGEVTSEEICLEAM